MPSRIAHSLARLYFLAWLYFLESNYAPTQWDIQHLPRHKPKFAATQTLSVQAVTTHCSPCPCDPFVASPDTLTMISRGEAKTAFWETDESAQEYRQLKHKRGAPETPTNSQEFATQWWVLSEGCKQSADFRGLAPMHVRRERVCTHCKWKRVSAHAHVCVCVCVWVCVCYDLKSSLNGK